MARKKIESEQDLNDYSERVENALDDYTGDLSGLLEKAEKAHMFEVNRNNHFDSKAGNYVGNVGVVLSVLSLIPILSVFLSFENGFSGRTWPEGLVLIPFTYAVLGLLLSAYYSTQALKIRGYQFQYTSNRLATEIEDGEPTEEEYVVSLLSSTKQMETRNLEKNNTISVAETFSRNSLIALGLCIGLTILFLSPITTLPTTVEIILTHLFE